MKLTAQLARHFRDVHFGGNWTSVDLKTVLADVDRKEATTKVDALNTIAALVFHINYYVHAVLDVLKGGSLEAKDKFSFDLPSISSEEDWQQLLQKTWNEAEEFAASIEQLPDEKLNEVFVEEKYGSYYRNLQGIIEHTHYHLGQIVLLKKLLKSKQS